MQEQGRERKIIPPSINDTHCPTCGSPREEWSHWHGASFMACCGSVTPERKRSNRIHLLAEETKMPIEIAERIVDADDEDIQRQVDEILAAKKRRKAALESIGRHIERILAAA